MCVCVFVCACVCKKKTDTVQHMQTGLVMAAEVDQDGLVQRDVDSLKSRYSLYSLYWYKSTKTDAVDAAI